jgi:hypothetical protein
VTGFRAWLRRNLWTVIALAVLGTASTLYAFAFDWRAYQDRRPTQPVDVARGDTGTLGAATFRLLDVVYLQGDSDGGRRYDVAEGTDVLIADVEVTPDPGGTDEDYVICDIYLHAPSPDGEREWWSTTTNPTTYPEPESNPFSCQMGYGPAYTIRLYFTVPVGGAEGGYLSVTSPEELPRALRLY